MENGVNPAEHVDRYLELLEDSIADPALKPILKSVEEYNKLFAELNYTADNNTDELKDIQAGLHELLTQINLLHVPVNVSGNISTIDDEGVVSTTSVDAKHLVFNGFVYHAVPVVALKYAFFERINDYSYRRWHADINGAVIDTGRNMSLERAIAILDINCPGIREEIDEQLFDISEDEKLIDAELMALRRLADIHYPLSDDLNISEIGHSVNVYVNSKIGFDQVLPYNLSIKGSYLISDDGGGYIGANGTVTDVIATRPKLEAYSMSATPKVSFLLTTEIYSNLDRTSPGVKIAIPLSSIVDFTSHRDLLYDN